MSENIDPESSIKHLWPFRTNLYIWCCFLCVQDSFGNWGTILTRKPRSHVRILISQKWPITTNLANLISWALASPVPLTVKTKAVGTASDNLKQAFLLKKIVVLSPCTCSQEPIKKTKQYTTAHQWLLNKERTMVIPLWTGTPGQNQNRCTCLFTLRGRTLNISSMSR